MDLSKGESTLGEGGNFGHRHNMYLMFISTKHVSGNAIKYKKMIDSFMFSFTFITRFEHYF
jgi:hypothetical protein